MKRINLNTIKHDYLVKKISHRQSVFFAILLTQLMIVIDGTVIYTALPSIAADLNVESAALSWIPNAYLLTFGGLLLLGGRTGDIIGHKPVFNTATLLFVIASYSAGLAESACWLNIFRAAQGIAAAFLAPSALALLMIYSPKGIERERTIKYYTAVSGIGSAFGLVLGGIITTYFSWRYLFFLNIPIGIIVFIIGVKRISLNPVGTPGRFDILGALVCTFGMTLLVYGLIQATNNDNMHSYLPILIGTTLILSLIFIEQRATQPIIPLSLFSCSARSGAYISKLLMIAGMLSMFFFLTQYTQAVLSYTPIETAIIFIPLSLSQFLMVTIGVAKFIANCGRRNTLILGLLITLSGMLWLSMINYRDIAYFDFLLPMLLLGMGSGTALVPLASFGVKGVENIEMGSASGLMNVTHYLGGALGIATTIYLMHSIKGVCCHTVNPIVLSSLISAIFILLATMISLYSAYDE